MTTETETYPDRTAYDNATKRNSIRHANGWRSTRNNPATLTRTWNNDPPPPPPPKRQLTQRQFIDELAEQNGVEII